jgi:hypothetical protein
VAVPLATEDIRDLCVTPTACGLVADTVSNEAAQVEVYARLSLS